MSIVDAQDVMKLRQKTKLGLMKCKAALEEANGDMALAEMNLRKEGLPGSDAPEDHEFSEGCIAVALNEDGSKCAIVEINTQTDFTARNDTFVAMAADLAQLALEQHAGQVEKTVEMQDRIDQLRSTTRENVSWRRGIVLAGGRIGTYIHHDRKTGVAVQIEGSIDDVVLHQLCLHVASADPAPLSVTEEGIPQDRLANEREIAAAQAMNSGKPEAIAERIMHGKLEKFLDSVVLLRQRFVMDSDKQIKDLLPPGTIIQRFVKFRIRA